jgi:hypothetical protein
MKNKSGDDIPPGKSHKFSLRFHSKSGGEKGGKSRRRRDEGDSGTNMGPPVPPP